MCEFVFFFIDSHFIFTIGLIVLTFAEFIGCKRKDGLKSKIFLLDYNLFKSDSNMAINKLWCDYFNFIKENIHLFDTVFVHNLGSFDGFFLYKALCNNYFNHPDSISTIIDDKNKFIQVSLQINPKQTMVWKDSYRIFPVSLKELCKVFKVDGKFSDYNSLFNNFNLFNDSKLLDMFIQYSLQDSISLFKALDKAQHIYFGDYSVDISTILSTSTLSLKIFRQNFLKKEIPVLKDSEDNFIRRGYFGGATDAYKCYGSYLHYYDVNSLYPFAMLNEMPLEMIKYHKDMGDVKLENFFGFCLAEVSCPNHLKIPLLPYKKDGGTIFPTGNWIGVYFSEELKEVVKHGYKVTLIKGYEFSKANLFNDYIQHFYNIKKFSSGPERFISKMHLNQLYGVFGRRKDTLQTKLIPNSELGSYLAKYIVKSIIEINESASVLLIKNNVNAKIVQKLNIFFETDFINPESDVKSNVAIASAVTAYARIHMVKLKMQCLNEGIDILYSDTDSIFTNKPLPQNLVGKELGQLKDELNNKVIQEAYFFGIKQYGYWFLDDFNNKIEQSVFAGVTRNSISFEDVKRIFNGGVFIHKGVLRFFKSFKDLNITIKHVDISVSKNSGKLLINNVFIPMEIINLNHELDNRPLYLKLKNLILKNLKLLHSFFTRD